MLALGVLLYVSGVPTAARLVLSAVAAISYNGLLDGGPSGQTIGKRILRIRVADDDTGTSIGPNRGIGRSGTTYLFGFAAAVHPLGVFVPLLDGLWPLWDQRRQTWHDKAVRSVVLLS